LYLGEGNKEVWSVIRSFGHYLGFGGVRRSTTLYLAVMAVVAVMAVMAVIWWVWCIVPSKKKERGRRGDEVGKLGHGIRSMGNVVLCFLPVCLLSLFYKSGGGNSGTYLPIFLT